MATAHPTSANSLTLYELNAHVRGLIETHLDEPVWLRAELSEARETRGHCYLEFVQKADDGNSIVARARGQIWANTWALLRPHFERATGQRLSAGMQVLVEVRATFHELYGYSLNVVDIDPTYTIGDMARKRMEIVAKLKEAGVFDLQKELSLPLFTQRIAVISSENAAGYEDFCNQLNDNDFGFSFQVKLFAATMQGETVEKSIIAALDSINAEMENFDCVVIIRGGGATADLSGFDTLALAENVSNFPLPVITGIGHERDESVLDMVSFLRVKTPTAAAAFLIDHLAVTAQSVEQCYQRIAAHISERLATHSYRLSMLSGNLVSTVEKAFLRERHRLEMLRHRAESLDPNLLLQRGYSITLKNGKAVRNADELKSGDIIETRLAAGIVQSEVVKSKS